MVCAHHSLAASFILADLRGNELYNNTGNSVFGVILIHAIGNVGRSVFPGGRSNFELAGGAVGYSIIAITAVIVAFLWGGKTLARYRFAKPADNAKRY